MAAAIFISHKETDGELAQATVDLLLGSLALKPEQIICTSVPGHMLKFGESIESQIRDGVGNQQVLLALLTKDSIRSSWVLFELGAAWAMRRLLVPIVGPSLSYAELPGALSQYPCISVAEPETRIRSRIDDALGQIAKQLAVERTTGAKQISLVDRLIKSLVNWKPVSTGESANGRSEAPPGYQLVKTKAGGLLYLFTRDPKHFVCGACWSKSQSLSQLQENGSEPTYATCPVCKHVYRLREDDPMPPYEMPSPSFF